MNKSNNNGNDNYNNELFRKVFHNKFLINKIINYIQSIEWVKYDDHTQLHIDNRLKFKDIHSLDWMLENKQYQLINSKLDNNDHIDINKKSITTLFNQLSTTISDNNTNTNTNTNSIELLKEILIKLLSNKRRRNEFEIVDLTRMAVECNSIEALKIITGKPFSIIIYPSTLLWAVQYSNPIMVSEILRLNNNNNINYIWKSNDDDKDNDKIFNLEFKKKILELSIKNYGHSIEMLKFISNKIISTTTDDNHQEQQQLLNLVKNLKLIYYKILNCSEIDSYSFEDLIIIYEIACNGEPSDIKDYSNLSIKELQKLTVIKYGNRIFRYNNIKYYQNYIKKYKETINEYHIKEESHNRSSISSDDPCIQEQLFKFKELIRIVDLFEDRFFTLSKFKNKESSILKDCVDGKLEWNELLNEILFKKINWVDEETSSKIVINDKETIDWIVNCRNRLIIIFIIDNFYILLIGTLELANQLYESIEILKSIYLQPEILDEPVDTTFTDDDYLELKIYTNVWYEAIKNSDFKTIESIPINNIIYQLSSLYKSPNEPLSIDQTISVINYFNEIGFSKLNDSFNYSLFLNQIVGSFDRDKDGGNKPHKQQVFSNIKLNFSINHHHDIIYSLINALHGMNLEIIQLLLNSNIFSQINQYNNIDMVYIAEHPFEHLDDYLINRQRNLFEIYPFTPQPNVAKLYFQESVANKFGIIELIKELASKSFKPICTKQDSSNNSNLIKCDPISSIVNYLFENLITIKGITFKEVVEIYQIIQQNSIIIEHTVYHSFWYLHIKDIKLSFYIMGCKQFIKLLSSGREGYYDCTLPRSGQFVYLQDYLEPSEFTFESISNLPFDTLLEMMVNKLSPISIIPINRVNFESYNELLNWELEYYLIIKRNDLFFKKLHQIKLELDKENNNNQHHQHQLFSKSLILYNSPSTTLLSNSTLFNNKQDDEVELTPIISSNLIDDFNNFRIQPLVYTFEFSNKVIEAIVKLLNLDEIKRVIKFNYYKSTFLNELFDKSIYYQRFDITKLILDNFKITITRVIPPIYDKDQSVEDDGNNDNTLLPFSTYSTYSFLLNNYFKFIQLPCKFELLENEIQNESFNFKFIYLLSNYFKFEENGNTLFNQFISSTTSTDNKMKILIDANLKITTTDVDDETDYQNFNRESTQTLLGLYKNDEYQLLFNQFFKSIEQQDQPSYCCSTNHQAQQEEEVSPLSCNYNEIEDNIFLTAFIDGDIKTSELILSHYHSNYQFKLTNQSITKTIENGNIHIINHYLNNHKSMFNNNDSLINHLKSKLRNHQDYNYLNKSININSF